MLLKSYIIKFRILLLIILFIFVWQKGFSNPDGTSTLSKMERDILTQAIAAISDLQKAKVTLSNLQKEYDKVMVALQKAEIERAQLLTMKNQLIDENKLLNINLSTLKEQVNLVTKQRDQFKEDLIGLRYGLIWLICAAVGVIAFFVFAMLAIRRKQNAN